jgi:hypothetical protein
MTTHRSLSLAAKRVLVAAVLLALVAGSSVAQDTAPLQPDDAGGSWQVSPKLPTYLPLMSGSAAYVEAAAAGVSPATWSATMAPGDCRDFTMSVTTGTYSPKLDVLFLIDTTGSMGDEINTMKSYSTNIMNQVRARVADSWFGVADFRDYTASYSSCGYTGTYGSASSGDYPWKLRQALTGNLSLAQSAVNGLSLGYGADTPESYSRALYEARLTAGWRAGAEGTIVLMGDAPAHDCEFYKAYGCSSYGVDPGRDAAAGTSDDLVFTQVINQLKNAQKSVISIYSTSDTCTQKGFQYASTQTSAGSFKYGSASDIPGAVVQEITNIASTTARLKLGNIPTAYQSWVTWTPSEYNNVPANTTKNFTVRICVPSGATCGSHSFRIHGLADGASLGSTLVNIEVPCSACAMPLRIELTWAKNNDLDAHFWLPKRSAYEVYFVSQGSAGVFPFAELDVDDLDGYGPENVRVNQLQAGTSNYAVHLFSGSPALRSSSAVVKIYSGGSLLRTFTVPTSGGGEPWWHVFSIDEKCNITTVNKLKWSNPGVYRIGESGPEEPSDALPLKLPTATP